MIKITVAIPVYNAAKSIAITLDSLLHQTMDKADFEVLCVNDCSTDNSIEVIAEYSKRMGNIVLLDRVENSGGPAAPRNDAIGAARGEYIHFLDNDDFLGEQALERLYKAAKQYGSDVIFGRHVGVNGRTVPLNMFRKGIVPKADFLKDGLVYSYAPHKMFRLAFLKEHGFKFPTDVIAGNDDLLFVMQCYIAAKVISIMGDYDYYFVVSRGRENLSKKVFPAHQYFAVFYQVIEFFDHFISDEDYKKQVKLAFVTRIINVSWIRHLVTYGFTQEQKVDWLNELNRFVDTCVNADLLKALDPGVLRLIEVARENNLTKLSQLRYGKRGYVYK